MSPPGAILEPILAPSGLEVPSDFAPRGSDRRTEPRFTSSDLHNRLAARHKYGEAVTLIDLSVGGVLFETPRIVRPDVDVVLEIIDARTREISQVISRVLRANVAGLTGGLTYRAACAFKRPLSHPMLLAPPAPPDPGRSPDYLKLELELKTIVEHHFKRARHGGGRDQSSVVDALRHLRAAAERRRDPIDRQLGALLADVIPALQRREPAAALVRKLHQQLASHLPLIAIRATEDGAEASDDSESLTFSMRAGANGVPLAITAEFPSGFSLDASQFRLLKLSAYLVGLVENLNAVASTEEPAGAPRHLESVAASLPVANEVDHTRSAGLPLGWHRVVLRYMDGQLLHGYTNDFYPDRACLPFSPHLGCRANERMLVPVARLKAVFFVRDLHGDRARVDVQTFDEKPRGRKVQVTFRDGEVLAGSTLSYKPNEQGFFVMPANARSNNIRVYVVTAAIRHIRFV